MKSSGHIGSKIAALRELKKMDLVELASRSGLSDEQMTLIESGISIPSLGVLIRVARALGIRIGTLLDDTVKDGPVLVKAGNRNASQSFSTSENRNREHLTFFSLAQDKAGRHMEPFIVDIEPGVDKHLNKSSHEGEEFIYVLKGSITVAYGTDIYELAEGDSIYLDSIVPHLVTARNITSQILGIVYVPV